MTTDRDRTIHLPDGRALGYAEYGADSGLPVLVFHGMPGSRLDLDLPGVDEELRERGLRALAIDRPGIGLSAPSPRRRLLDWPADVEAFADALGLDRYAVLGLSAGGPHALACARHHGGRILAAGVVAAPAPPGVPELASVLSSDMRRAQQWARWFPARLKGEMRRLGTRLAAPETAADQLTSSLSEADRAVLADVNLGGLWLASWREAFRQGPDGPWRDLVVISRPWGFSPPEIDLPVLLWFGAADRQVPPAIGRYLANALQRSEARLYAHEGHFSLLTHRSDEILDGMAAAVGRATHHS